MATAALLIAANQPRCNGFATHLCRHGLTPAVATVFAQSLLSIAVRYRNHSCEIVVLDASLGRYITDTLADHFDDVPVIIADGPNQLDEILDLYISMSAA